VLSVTFRVDGIGPDRVLQRCKLAQLRLNVLLDAGPGFAAPVLADGINVTMGLGFRDSGSGCDFGEAEAFKQKGGDFDSPCNNLGVFACFSVICGQMASLKSHGHAKHEPGPDAAPLEPITRQTTHADGCPDIAGDGCRECQGTT